MEKSDFSSTFALAFGKPVALTNDLTKFLSPFGRTIISWGPRKARANIARGKGI